jgi:hypothetical protein
VHRCRRRPKLKKITGVVAAQYVFHTKIAVNIKNKNILKKKGDEKCF